ncbi:uncharacterized protein C4orf17 homolog [Numida meleagris]|uniref:uncharacterized protein C4orf17 homolog n=1 Tax=Numida meleagris TaxID=8996 RepID=UPI000B3DE4B0|nr:uncharacterized protein C4orf17 homolog [Numida meleagris]XP_021248990.1 uncharacterized protein C4orf17 homolog [Numida meleagris]XP_021248992.1 uncharacterized protein C4orf17 homolog [Numida meleagris]
MNTCRHCPHSSSSWVTYSSRNVPHPRMLCHIQGLDNSPICSVRHSCFRELPSADKTAILEQKADGVYVLDGNARGNLLANHCLPRLEAFMQRGPGSSQLAAQHGEGLANFPERTQSNPTSPEKLLKKRPQTCAQPATTQGVLQTLSQPSSACLNLSHGPHVQQNADFDLSYLHWEIKVLDKLRKLFQTDSLTEIQEWLSKASIKEKVFVSRLIYSELTGKGQLNNQPRATQDGAGENTNTHSLLKPRPPSQRGPEGDINNRPSTNGSEASQNMEHKTDKDCILFSKLRNRGPAHADTLPPEKSHGWQWKRRDLPSHGALQQAEQQIDPFQRRPTSS